MSRKILFILTLLSCVSCCTFAENRPQVAVRFKIEASAYRQHFGGQTANVENHAAQLLVQELKRHVQFAQFELTGGQIVSYTLTVSLTVADPNTDVAAQPVWLVSSLAGSGGMAATSRWRKFREAAADCGGLRDDQQCTWPNESEFLKELQLLLAAPSAYTDLVTGVFQGVSIANSGKFVVQPLSGWILPFREEDVCLGLDTKLRIVNDIPTAQTTLHGKFRADVEGPWGHPPEATFTTLSEGEDGSDNNKKSLLQQSPDNVVVRGVYLVRYQHLDENCGNAIPPATASGSEGGDQ